jgi:hypothetical protein
MAIGKTKANRSPVDVRRIASLNQPAIRHPKTEPASKQGEPAPMEDITRHSPPAEPAPAWRAIRAAVEQPPRLHIADYVDDTDPSPRDGLRLYEATKKRIGRDKIKALALLDQAAGMPYDRASMAEATEHAWSGRLYWTWYGELRYTPGQHGAEEYRAAIVALLRYYIDAAARGARQK